ncbi:ABC transporter substrate-binding protein [Microbulbifer sp. S227A]|uniref:ABC transporter substrate-binding protein n=1 Tax=Microbulbifer sp. S227A TaxID=3415131 RepID=UPI003C7E4993
MLGCLTVHPVLRSAILCAALLIAPVAAGADIPVTDITGREVTLAAPATRIVLGDARHVVVLGMIDDNPVSRIVGWRQDKALDPARMAALRAKFPAIDDIAPVGAGNRRLSVESTIALAPDLVVLSLIDARDPRSEQALLQLEAAGIPVIFVDFFSHPLENTTKSISILSRVIGGGDKAEALVDYYETHLATIRDRLEQADPPRPDVFVQVHATPDQCCATVGGGVFHDFVTAAGGHNLGADAVPGIMGNVGLENLIAMDPDFFLASGGAHLRARDGLVLGAGIDRAEARDSFAALLAAPGLRDLRATETGNAMGFWHLFNDSPMHIALIEHLARRFHPTLFADLDPAATLREMQERFAPVSVAGTWWIDAP